MINGAGSHSQFSSQRRPRSPRRPAPSRRSLGLNASIWIAMLTIILARFFLAFESRFSEAPFLDLRNGRRIRRAPDVA